jgi:hypothetical protein
MVSSICLLYVLLEATIAFLDIEFNNFFHQRQDDEHIGTCTILSKTLYRPNAVTVAGLADVTRSFGVSVGGSTVRVSCYLGTGKAMVG